MKKKAIGFIMAFVLVFGATAPLAVSAATTPAQSPVTAQPSAHSVQIDGENVAFTAFNIGGNNFFRLRDIAYALNGTPSQFNVQWLADFNAILIQPGYPYEPIGGEMSVNAATLLTVAPPAPVTFYIFPHRELDDLVWREGGYVGLAAPAAVNINGSNFFMLRELGEIIGFSVDWDEATSTILISTNP